MLYKMELENQAKYKQFTGGYVNDTKFHKDSVEKSIQKFLQKYYSIIFNMYKMKATNNKVRIAIQ